MCNCVFKCKLSDYGLPLYRGRAEYMTSSIADWFLNLPGHSDVPYVHFLTLIRHTSEPSLILALNILSVFPCRRVRLWNNANPTLVTKEHSRLYYVNHSRCGKGKNCREEAHTAWHLPKLQMPMLRKRGDTIFHAYLLFAQLSSAALRHTFVPADVWR
jgi:hypothetical protein